VKHIVYKTTNKINSKYYIGVHSTKNINDSYLGCGHWHGRKICNATFSPILNAFKKYGDNNFSKEVLFVFENREDALQKEKELIDINDSKCYNARTGGDSNYTYTTDIKLKMSKQAKIRSKKILLQTNLLKEHVQNRIGKTYTEIYGEEKAKEITLKKSKSLTGRKCSLEHRQKMSQNRKGKDCGNCKGRKKVLDITTNKIIRLFPIDIEQLIKEKKIIKETKKVSKFHAVNYIKIT
jgi:hypothetical protein